MDKMPKVSIAVVGVVIAQIGGFIWWTAQQASTISNLEETVNVLTVENNATDRTNLMRDVEENTERIEELIDYVISLEEEGQETLEDVYLELDEFEEVIYEDIDGMLLQFNQIVKLQARVKTLENTLEYLTRRPIHSDGR